MLNSVCYYIIKDCKAVLSAQGFGLPCALCMQPFVTYNLKNLTKMAFVKILGGVLILVNIGVAIYCYCINLAENVFCLFDIMLRNLMSVAHSKPQDVRLRFLQECPDACILTEL